MAVHLRTISLFLVLTAATLALIWLVSTEEQRLEYKVWLGLAEPHIEAKPEQDILTITSNNQYPLYTQHGAVKPLPVCPQNACGIRC